MRRFAIILPVLVVAGCAATGPKPAGTPSDPKDCQALEAKRQQLVAKFNSLPQSAVAEIDRTSLAIEEIGKQQVEKGCAG